MELASTTYSQALLKGKELGAAVDKLLASPTPETLAAARAAWKESRHPYQRTEGFRFGNKIVDDWEGRVNSWPLDEGLIDYVDTSSYGETKDENPAYTADIIANKTLKLGDTTLDATTIDKALIAKLNGLLDVEANVGTGYHAIEFLLWGQDLNGTGPGAGNRPATDYDLKACTGGNCDRRRAYLKAATDLLIDDLTEMAGDWAEGGAARKQLLAKSESDQLASILTGLGSLSYGELAGERMKLGVLLHDTEEEHDCFSDDTHNSHYNDQVGMMSIWNGEADFGKPFKVPSIADLARAKDPNVAKRVDDAMAVTLSKMKAIKDKAETGGMAYDQMLAAGNAEGNKLILDAVDALVAQTRAVEAVVAALGLKINVEGSDSLDNASAVGAQ
ncbi:MAG: peptidase [Hyphomicrobiaceae bacterium]|nr:peptidase [Hyphomicrobiaceae bacterium]